MLSHIHAGRSMQNMRFCSTLKMDGSNGGDTGRAPSSWHLSLNVATMNDVDAMNQNPKIKAAIE
jgi:hypothetical protein